MYDRTFKDGSVWELLSTSAPLMFTWLSTTLMMFIDRLFLAKYSLEALGAAINAGTIAWAFAYGVQLTLEMAQVTVARKNGAKQHKELGAVSWQMLWLAAASIAFFLPLAWWGGVGFFSSEADSALQQTYFRWLMIFGPAFGLIGASASFFIGRGVTKIVTFTAVAGNLCNIALDWILIFGIEGVLPAMGVKGAAIATGLGMLVQGGLLSAFFLKQKHREDYGTGAWQFNAKLCWSALRIGLPTGLLVGLELFAWGIFFSLMAHAGTEHLLVTSICHTMLPLIACYGIGLQKGTAAVSGNLIGAGATDKLPKVLWSGIQLICGYYLLLALGLLFSKEWILDLFLSRDVADPSQILRLRELVTIGLWLSCGYLFCGGLRLVAGGVLSAAGDSLFLMISGTVAIWVLLLLPTYLIVVMGGASVSIAQSLLACYGLLAALIVYCRFAQGKWKAQGLALNQED